MADGAGVEDLLARGKYEVRKQKHSPELSHPEGQLGGSRVRRSCSGTIRRLSKPKLEGQRSSLAEDETGLL